MPVYDYKCECGKTRTQTVSIKEQEFRAVCDCGKDMKRVYSAPNIKFNGSGFYTTDKGDK
jgi:putative FmdB family regulatory protein